MPATQLDVAGAIIDHIADRAAFPDIDLRQRLPVSTGYGVAELIVLTDAGWAGGTLEESGLRERDISVLTLHRGTAVLPNPKRTTVLEAGDRLLCFGKLDEMGSLVPERRKRGNPRTSGGRVLSLWRRRS